MKKMKYNLNIHFSKELKRPIKTITNVVNVFLFDDCITIYTEYNNTGAMYKYKTLNIDKITTEVNI